MNDADELAQDVADELGLPLGTVVGVCAELAKSPDRAQMLALCNRWGLGWPELQRLSEMRRHDLSAIGKGIASQAAMICAVAQGALARQLSNPAITEMLQPKELSAIAKQQNDIMVSQLREPAPAIGGGNTFNIIGGNIQEIMALKEMQREPSAAERLAARGVTIPVEV